MRCSPASRSVITPACNRYGSYEACIEPSFALERLPLVDRGFVYAIAHVRGGGELGRLWHENGKFLKKRNTFTDFIAAAEHLVALEYTRPELLCAEVSTHHQPCNRAKCRRPGHCLCDCSSRVRAARSMRRRSRRA